MAKLGEGDERWIVQDRADGTNVNNWHWTEKDVGAWARQRLSQLLGGLTLFSDAAGSATTTSVESVKGDTIINIRKGKMIATYELEVSVGFKGSAGNKEVVGTLSLPYISEENHDEEPEVRVLTAAEGPAAGAVKKGILGNKQVISEAVGTFVKELRAGGPHAPGAATGDAAPAGTAGGGGGGGSGPAASARGETGAAAGASARPPAVLKPVAKAAAKKNDGATQSFQLEEKFYARAADIFEALTDEKRMRAWTQSEATSQPRADGTYSIYSGAVTGTYKEVQAPSRIVQDWRFSSWADGVTSRVAIDIKEPDAGTVVVTLKQSGIPREDRHGNPDVLRTVEAGWRGQVFQRIRAVFGYGY